MHTWKYARLENERRFWVPEPPDFARARPRIIEDLYLENSRLRIRAITHPDGAAPEFKLCKKYGSNVSTSEPITNLYLSAEEHRMLSALPGRRLRKRRYSVPYAKRIFSLDLFEGELTGLVLCETEADSPETILTIDFPPWATREVTADPFFTGGNLVRLSAAALKARLDAMRAL